MTHDQRNTLWQSIHHRASAIGAARNETFRRAAISRLLHDLRAALGVGL